LFFVFSPFSFSIAGHRANLLPAAEFGLPDPESIMLPMADGVKVHLWLFLHDADVSRQRGTVIFFHGNAGNLSFRNENYRGLFHEAGLNVLAVEYRGFGVSEGVPGEAQMTSDALEVLDWLLQRPEVDAKKIFVLGRSIGGAVAVHLAKSRQQKLAGLILENTFTRIGDLVDILMPKLSYFKFLLTNPWSNEDVVKELAIPCLFISSGRDELIPKAMMERLREQYAGTVKEWVFYPDAQHMNAHTFPYYNFKIKQFVESCTK
jgi:fermentation-respiration switch protein FrsA (DUF1100 family)